MKVTPKDSIDALRLMRKHQDVLLEADSPDEEKEQIQGIAAAYCAQKRQQKTDLEFLEWYESADLADLAVDEEEPDPTA